jgi:hypothetical protein
MYLHDFSLLFFTLPTLFYITIYIENLSQYFKLQYEIELCACIIFVGEPEKVLCHCEPFAFCRSEPFTCHSERSEESIWALRTGSVKNILNQAGKLLEAISLPFPLPVEIASPDKSGSQ